MGLPPNMKTAPAGNPDGAVCAEARCQRYIQYGGTR